MASGMRSPHLLLASGNPVKMIKNLSHLLTLKEIAKLRAELDRNVAALFTLGLSHYNFAFNLADLHWRQKISRLYYGVYNIRRAVVLKHNGSFSTDSSDHKDIEKLPNNVSNRETHIANLRNLREDRNLADYSHLGELADLILSPDEALAFATLFIADCRQLILGEGVRL